MPLPETARWIGVAFGLLTLPLIWWIQWALDLNFNTVLHVRERHTLVKHGPYKWVRHPMYTALYLHGISIFLTTQNWLLGLLYLGSLSVIGITRIHNEENAMIETFGKEYQTHMTATGRFLPKIIQGG